MTALRTPLILLFAAWVLGACTVALDPMPDPPASATERHAGADLADCPPSDARERVALSEGYVTRLESLLEEVRQRRAAGNASPTDVAQVEARLAEARADLAEARAALATSRAALAEATGRRPAVACRGADDGETDLDDASP